jgi:hypothetical protein
LPQSARASGDPVILAILQQITGINTIIYFSIAWTASRSARPAAAA